VSAVPWSDGSENPPERFQGLADTLPLNCAAEPAASKLKWRISEAHPLWRRFARNQCLPAAGTAASRQREFWGGLVGRKFMLNPMNQVQYQDDQGEYANDEDDEHQGAGIA
jgi:hypothetical protein